MDNFAHVKVETPELQRDLEQLRTKHGLTIHQLYLVSLGAVLRSNAIEEQDDFIEEDEGEGADNRPDAIFARYLENTLENFQDDPDEAVQGLCDDWEAAFYANTGKDPSEVLE